MVMRVKTVTRYGTVCARGKYGKKDRKERTKSAQ